MTRNPVEHDHEPPAMRRLAAEELRLVSVLVVILGAGLFMALPFVLSAGQVVFLPLVAAIIISVVLSPLADRLSLLGVPNMLASFIAILAIIAVVIMALLLILQPAADLLVQFPALVTEAGSQFSRLRSNFDWINDINEQLASLAGRSPNQEVVVAAPSMLEQVAVATPSVILEVILTLLMAFFMIEARVRLRRHLLLDRASFGTSLKAARVLRDVQDRVGSYILTVATINLGVGVITALGAWAFGLEAPIMWGGLAAMLNFLPYIGPIAMIATLALFGIGTGETIIWGLLPAVSYLGLHAIEANLVTPAILGRRFTVNPVLILLSISYFSWIWGVVGALLSVPILITVTALLHHVGQPNLIGFIFGEPLFASIPDSDTEDIA
jgi:predicted PurR-regulated permease PerM